MTGDRLPNTAAVLREAFDRAFAEAPQGPSAQNDDFLAIRVGTEAHAVPLAEVAQLLPLPPLTRLPSPVSEFLGVAGIAGAVVPVYDLAALLGHARNAPPRWIVVCAAAAVALAFDAFEGQIRIARAAGEAAPRDLLRHAGRLLPITALDALVAVIRSRVSAARNEEEV